MFKMLIADNHAIFLKSLYQLIINSYPDIDLVQGCNAEDTYAKIQEQKWDIVLLDLNVFRPDGLKTIQQIKATVPHTPILVMGIYESESITIKSKVAGAADYIQKDRLSEDIIKFIKPLIAAKSLTPTN